MTTVSSRRFSRNNKKESTPTSCYTYNKPHPLPGRTTSIMLATPLLTCGGRQL